MALVDAAYMNAEKELRIRVQTYSNGYNHSSGYTIAVMDGITNLLMVSSQTPLPAKGTPERRLIGEMILKGLGLD